MMCKRLINKYLLEVDQYVHTYPWGLALAEVFNDASLYSVSKSVLTIL